MWDEAAEEGRGGGRRVCILHGDIKRDRFERQQVFGALLSRSARTSMHFILYFLMGAGGISPMGWII